MYVQTPLSLDADPCFGQTWVGRLLAEAPVRAIDVGARDGFHPLFRRLGALCSVLGFEPDPEGYAALRADQSLASAFASVHFEPLAVGAGGTQTFHTFAAPTNNSLLPGNDWITRRYKVVKMEPRGSFEIETHRLDDVIFDPAKQLSGFGEIIKLDTQGSELEILENATRMLRDNTVAIVSEVWFCPLYSGQPLFHQICSFAEQHGFQFYGFSDLFLRSGKRLDKHTQVGRERALYADAIFLRDPLSDDPARRKCPPDRRQLALLIAFAITIGYFDFALELIEHFSGGDRVGLSGAVHRFAQADVEGARRDFDVTSDQVNGDAVSPMVAMGRFADRWRAGFDYTDVA